MLNIIWLGMIFISFLISIFTGRIDALVQSVITSSKLAFEIALGLTGIMTLWLGIMNIATESGLNFLISKLLKPLLIKLFPDVPPEHPAMGAIVLNIAANMLGLGNAATPFGLKAMQELQKLNTHVHTATNAMCTFLAINTSSVQLIPATAIAYLTANGSTDPTSIVFSSIIATTISTIVALIAVTQLAKLPMYKVKPGDTL
jgi:spore maturation protein A